MHRIWAKAVKKAKFVGGMYRVVLNSNLVE